MRPEPIRSTVCHQCGYSHPPIPQGAECPMKKKTDNYGQPIEVTDFFSKLKKMIESQIQMKKIKDHQKFYNLLILQINKIIEGYKE